MQVFPPGISDHFRNRLTHTIEVAQIARTVAPCWLDEDLTEALALGHDIGHPPFAHAGEEELNRQMRRFGERFDHNLHALRIVEIFEQRYARFPGLNLTFEVREGIVKHSRDFEQGENSGVRRIPSRLAAASGGPAHRPGRRIAYNTADLDDAFSAGMLTPEEIAEAVPEYRLSHDAIETQFPGAPSASAFRNRCATCRFAGLRTDRGTVEAAVHPASGCRRGRAAIPGGWPCSRRSAGTRPRTQAFLHPSLRFAALADRHRSTAMIAELFHFSLAEPGRLPEPIFNTRSEPPIAWSATTSPA